MSSSRESSQPRSPAVQANSLCPCILGKALGGHLEMLLAVGEGGRWAVQACPLRSEEHTSELQSP